MMNRRRFFKKAVRGMLPMLGAFVAGPTVIMNTLTSCGPDDGCDDCSAACSSNCSSSCQYSSGGGCSDCSSSCADNSESSVCSSCANDCSKSCNNTCQEGCSNSCEGSTTGKATTGSINGHEYVDLGLSVLWATCNIGSANPKGNGTYFGFGDITGGNYWNWSLGDKMDELGANSICGTKYDAARQQWGGRWKMPSKDEFD